jgi:hypothetical protein
MTGRVGEAPIASKQRDLERFGKRNIDAVVSLEIVSEIPDAEQQGIVRICQPDADE